MTTASMKQHVSRISERFYAYKEAQRETITLQPLTVVKTVMGEWVQVVEQWDNMVTVDSVGGYEHRTQVHISKLLLNTAHQLSKNVCKAVRS